MELSFIDSLEHELEYFSNKNGIKMFGPATEEAITSAEMILGCNFSPQMKKFFKNYNGGRILEVRIQGIPSLGYKQIPKDVNIVETNQLLKALNNWNTFWLHIGSDGFGNLYVVDLNRILETGEYPVFFIDHEQIGNEEFSFQYAISYSEFILKVVAEMKHIYTPSGDLKE